jgi:AraC-like DNA-binding protein
MAQAPVLAIGAPEQLHRPERSCVAVADPDHLRDFLTSAYETRMRLSRIDTVPRHGRPLMTHARTDVGSFALDEIHLACGVDVLSDPLNKVVAAAVVDGQLAGRCNGLTAGAAAGEATMAAQPDLPHYSHAEGLHSIVLLLDPALVAGIATGIPTGREPPPIRFSSFTPVDAAAGRRWQDTVAYVKDVVLGDDILATPLVLGSVGRLLAAVTLSTFPHAATPGSSPHDRNDHQPVLLRRAIEFIESNVIEDIGLVDIAEAVCVTPRALQYMFRRHLDTTPMQYLRRARLHHAHTDLLASDRRRETVAAISARWGFMHTSRFAVFYRQTYGQSPHVTLRSGRLSWANRHNGAGADQ